jgi:hypothetical protein
MWAEDRDMTAGKPAAMWTGGYFGCYAGGFCHTRT